MKYNKNLTFKRKIRIRNRGTKEFCDPLANVVWLEMFGGSLLGAPDVKSRFYGRLGNIRTYYTPRRKPTREYFAY